MTTKNIKYEHYSISAGSDKLEFSRWTNSDETEIEMYFSHVGYQGEDATRHVFISDQKLDELIEALVRLRNLERT